MRVWILLAGASAFLRTERIAQPGPAWNGTTPDDLFREYENIFPSHNRNAASHLWFAFLLRHAAGMSSATFEELNGGYCSVSGSPVHPSAATRYRMTLPRADGGGDVQGSMYYCCWPCVCDTQDFIRVDTKTVTTGTGSKKYDVAVIGNPCSKPGRLSASFPDGFGRTTSIQAVAPEVRCDGHSNLLGLCKANAFPTPSCPREPAPLSDHGHPILGLFFRASEPPNAVDGHSEAEYAQMCAERAAAGYNSGMGEIFRRVAGISPINAASISNGTRAS
jgi:hypothetical protein